MVDETSKYGRIINLSTIETLAPLDLHQHFYQV